MKTTIFAALAASLAFAGSSQAAGLLFDENVTPNVIFGSGNANGGYTVDRSNGIEIGLRGKLRFNAANQPENTFNSNGDGSYSFDAGKPVGGGFGFASGSPATPVWNFEWSINSDFAGATGKTLSDFQYLFEIDGDPTAGTVFTDTFDPINVSVADHSLGDNSTANGQGVETGDPTTYANRIGSLNVAQNSWSYEFFNDGPAALSQLVSFAAATPGIYTIRLSAIGDSGTLAMSSIDIKVNAVPLPATLPLLLGALGAVAFIRRKRA